MKKAAAEKLSLDAVRTKCVLAAGTRPLDNDDWCVVFEFPNMKYVGRSYGHARSFFTLMTEGVTDVLEGTGTGREACATREGEATHGVPEG